MQIFVHTGAAPVAQAGGAACGWRLQPALSMGEGAGTHALNLPLLLLPLLADKTHVLNVNGETTVADVKAVIAARQGEWASWALAWGCVRRELGRLHAAPRERRLAQA